MLQVHVGSAVFSSKSPALWHQSLSQVASQQLQCPDLCAHERGEFMQGASLTCSVHLLSMSSQYREVDTRQTPSHRSLEVSLCKSDILFSSLKRLWKHGKFSSAGSLPETFLKDNDLRSKTLMMWWLERQRLHCWPPEIFFFSLWRSSYTQVLYPYYFPIPPCLSTYCTLSYPASWSLCLWALLVLLSRMMHSTTQLWSQHSLKVQ